MISESPPAHGVAALDRHGVLVVGGVIAAVDLPALRREFDRIMGVGRGRAGARSPLAESVVLRTLAQSRTVRGLVEPVLGASARLVRSLLFDKREGANWEVTWHRDTTIAVRERREAPGYGPWSVKAGVHHVRPPLRVLECMLTVRLHFDECDERNGALLVVPGSHRDEGGGIDLSLVPDPVSCRARAVVCPVPAGGALLMRPLILHASKKALDPQRRRRVLHLEFAATPLDGGLQWAGEPNEPEG